MAKLISTIFLIISSILIATPNDNHATTQIPQQEGDNAWFQSVCQGKENKAKLHFYVHDQFTGENQTVFEVARASITSTSPSSFGQVFVADDPLTVEPVIESEEVGRVQGLVTSADLSTSSLAMNLNFVFTPGKYNGSTISIVGRNPLMQEERELLIVGGTGVFRFVHGYAIVRTIVFNTDRATFEYTLYVTYGGDSSTSDEAKHADLGRFN